MTNEQLLQQAIDECRSIKEVHKRTGYSNGAILARLKARGYKLQPVLKIQPA